MNNITVQSVEDTIRLLATEQPERTADCHYVGLDGNLCVVPECIVGNAFHRLGVDLDTLSDWEDNNASDLMRAFCVDWNHTINDGHWADKVQEAQDQGTPWREAVVVADRLLSV